MTAFDLYLPLNVGGFVLGMWAVQRGVHSGARHRRLNVAMLVLATLMCVAAPLIVLLDL